METIKNAVSGLVFGKQEVETATPAHPLWDSEKNMKCLIWNGKETVEYVSHARPMITAPTDILLKVTATTICGSDLHMYKGTFTGMKPRDIIGHEFMGVIEEVGDQVTKLKVGQRVVVGFAIACGECEFCKRKEYTACDRTNPSRMMEKEYSDRLCGVYGYSHYTGGIPGGQAEYVRVAFAEFNCLPLPDSVPDEKALYLTDIIPTSYHGVVNGEVDETKTVGIWGLGPIGLMTAQWCKLLGAKRIIGIDCEPERIALARDHLGIEVINFKEVDSVVKIIEDLIGGHLDVGIEAAGFSFAQSWSHKLQMKLGLETDTSEIFCEMFRCVRKFGNISIVGDYFGYANHFPVGAMMEKAFTIRSGQDPLQKYWKYCLEKVESGEIDPTFLITHRGSLADGPRFYKMMNDQELIKCFMRPEHLTI